MAGPIGSRGPSRGTLAEAIRETSLRLYGYGAARLRSRRGILLADTKFEIRPGRRRR